MLTAAPGRGRITRATLSAWPDDPGMTPARLVPRRRAASVGWADDDEQVKLASSVDLVLPHPQESHATGAVLTVTDAAAAASAWYDTPEQAPVELAALNGGPPADIVAGP